MNAVIAQYFKISYGNKEVMIEQMIKKILTTCIYALLLTWIAHASYNDGRVFVTLEDTDTRVSLPVVYFEDHKDDIKYTVDEDGKVYARWENAGEIILKGVTENSDKEQFKLAIASSNQEYLSSLYVTRGSVLLTILVISAIIVIYRKIERIAHFRW